MQKLQESPKFFLIYSLFLATLAILILGGVLLSPSEPDNSIVFGLSLPRLVLASGLVSVFVFFSLLSIKAVRDHAWAKHLSERWFGESRPGQAIPWFAAIGLGLGWIGCFLPFYRAGLLAVHWDRLRPAMLFILFASLATLTMVFLKRSNFAILDSKIAKIYKTSLILFIPSILVIGWMLATGFGVYAPEDYWYGAGVPLLISQLIAAGVGGILFLRAEKSWRTRRLDLIIFLLICIVTAILWAREPLQKSFLFIGPHAPNRVLYPFADGALYDTASQFALIGKHFLFNNGPFFERALYASFLAILHSLFGQDYGRLMAAQAAVFAVFPALVYLIGRTLNARAVGFAAALVAMFRGANSIAASNMIDMANPKMMLTDFPTAIGVALIILLSCAWLRTPERRGYYALWIGGVIGLSIMLRTNALVFLLFVPLLAILASPLNWKQWLTTSFLVLVAVIAVTLPWELRNQSLGGKMYSSFIIKFQRVIELRYRSPLPPESFIPQENTLFSILSGQTQVLLELVNKSEPTQETSCNTVICFVPNHFLHNVLTSILVLPTSPVMDDLRHTVKESYPYWQPDWKGSFTNVSFFFFLLNGFLIVLGIIVAWRQHRWIGLVPLAVFGFYNLSNGFARTSGGRYIVPVDWIITLYFLIGVFQTAILLANSLGATWTLFSESNAHIPPRQDSVRTDFARGLVILTLLFGLGSLIPLAETLHTNRYQDFDISRTLSERETQIVGAGLSLQDVNSFLQDPNAEISVGRVLYPRYYIENEGEVHFYPVVRMGFPRITFTLIGNEGEKGIVLPGEKPEHFPHAVDAIVIGCKEQYYVDALAVILLDETGAIYTRSPESPLQCPLKQPVCDNNHNCY
ncbi:MAG TPA: hypothetical protein VFG81_08980 [Anaerolineales bacterium]|jgi:hypothetical protein|nr:hypothetical protein [Anaerolineales bacterium]